MSMPAYMKSYSKRLARCMVGYVVILMSGLTYHRSGETSELVSIGLALITALPVCGVFWTMRSA